MPELPEVERVRHSLARQGLGRKAQRVQLHRREIVRGPATPTALLARQPLTAIERRGKQIALIANTGRCVCIHLGMTGSLRWHAPSPRTPRARSAANGHPPHHAHTFPPSTDPADRHRPDPHIHLIWHFTDGTRLEFRDPRRFGGLWTYPSLDALHADRWDRLGEDALTITASRLHRRLRATRRPLKTALLDQGLVAGLGNIYVDELLFAARLAPTRPAATLSLTETRALVRRMRTLLHRAIAAGGSTFRDYIDPTGSQGGFQQSHRVYGRGEQPCLRCRRPLSVGTIAGRTSVFCTSCQSA